MCVQCFIQDSEFWDGRGKGGGGGKLQCSVLMWSGYTEQSGDMQPTFFIFLIDALRLILGHSGAKRKVYTARLSFIWVVKEKRGWG